MRISNRKPYPDEFEAYWQSTAKRHGKRLGKRATFREWEKEIKNGAEPDELIRASRAYTRYCADNDVFPKDPERFLRQGTWEDFADEPDPVKFVTVEPLIAHEYFVEIGHDKLATRCQQKSVPEWLCRVPEDWLKAFKEKESHGGKAN